MKDKYRAIYQPRGAALEYSPLALNLYTGCPHGCQYCYVPGCLHKTPEEFHGHFEPRKNIVDIVRRDLDEMDEAVDFRPVLLCFTCDPYPGESADNIVTRRILELFKEYNKPFQLLTKAGMKSARDFDLYKPGDAYAATLTLISDSASMLWEPEAALPLDRVASLEAAKKRGITTWVSFEPVIHPINVFRLYELTKDFVDLYKIGKMNHRESDVNWRAFGEKMVEMCERDGKAYLIKDALRKEMNP